MPSRQNFTLGLENPVGYLFVFLRSSDSFDDWISMRFYDATIFTNLLPVAYKLLSKTILVIIIFHLELKAYRVYHPI